MLEETGHTPETAEIVIIPVVWEEETDGKIEVEIINGENIVYH